MESRISITYGREDFQDCPPKAFEALIQAGFLSRASDSKTIWCALCQDEHDIIRDGAGALQVECSEASLDPTPIPVEHLSVWGPSSIGLARFVTQTLGDRTEPTEVYPDRLWYCGRPVINRIPVNVYIGRGTSWTDANRVFDRADLRDATILTVCPDPSSTLPLTVNAIPLASLLTLTDNTIGLISDALISPSAASSATNEEPFKHSEDFRWAKRVRDGREFDFSRLQAHVLRGLIENWRAGVMKVTADALMTGSDSSSSISDVFRDKKLRDELIQRDSSGLYSLKV